MYLVEGKRFRGRLEWVRRDSIGEGGQGFAYLATRVEDGSAGWVLKTIRESVPTERFELEIEALRRLDSPRIARVEDYSIEPGHRFYVTAYRGESLMKSATAKLMTVREQLNVFADVVQGVADAHSVAVAHRDIKPSNIVIDPEGRACLIDFGLCAVFDDHLVSITSQDKYGNEAFAAPECLHGSPMDCGMEADVYSLGKCLFWMASGGEYIHRESLYGVVPDLIRDEDPWIRIQASSLIRATVSDVPSARPTASELLSHTDEVREAIDQRRERAAIGEIPLWDTLGPGDTYSQHGSRSITAPPFGNPPNYSELALRFHVPSGPRVELIEVSIPLTVRAGSGEFLLRLHSEQGVEVGTVIHEWALQVEPHVTTLRPSRPPVLQPGEGYWLSLAIDEGEIAWWAAENRTLAGLTALFSERYGRSGRWPVHETQLGHACRLVGRVLG